MTAPYVLSVNGSQHEVPDAWLGESLLYVLRERLDLPGAKAGCEQGECGSCSVIVDGAVECSCLVLAAAAVGREITTVEGLQPDRGGFNAVQGAFLAEGAVQCGFCTPGLVVVLTDLLAQVPHPSDLEVREAISGNLCRCTGYGRILAAAQAAAAVASAAVTTPSSGPVARASGGGSVAPGSAAGRGDGPGASSGASSGAAPGGDPAGDPGAGPGGDPAGDPGAGPGGDPGAGPGGDPGAGPGGDPGAGPGGDPGAGPGGDSGGGL